VRGGTPRHLRKRLLLKSQSFSLSRARLSQRKNPDSRPMETCGRNIGTNRPPTQQLCPGRCPSERHVFISRILVPRSASTTSRALPVTAEPLIRSMRTPSMLDWSWGCVPEVPVAHDDRKTRSRHHGSVNLGFFQSGCVVWCHGTEGPGYLACRYHVRRHDSVRNRPLNSLRREPPIMHTRSSTRVPLPGISLVSVRRSGRVRIFNSGSRT